MTDRHLHCVYFKFDNPDNPSGYCLLNQKKIEWGFKPHCENYVLRPSLILSYFLVHKGYCSDWAYSDNQAIDYIKKIGFNDYPKKNTIKCLCEENIEFNEELIHQDSIIQCLNEKCKRLEEEKELIKNKLLKYILNYNKIAVDNWNYGLSESIETIHNEVEELFKNPAEWLYMYDCNECEHFESYEDNYDIAYCNKFQKEISYFKSNDCEEFKWK